jgi:peptidyl-prolyl cis-trans isomerase D
MLKKLRENMKMILWITIIAFIALIFLAWGMDIQSGRGPKPGTLAKVNGRTITSNELDQAVRNTFDLYEKQFGRQPSEAETDALREQAWENLVQRIILNQEADRRNLQATDEEVVYSIRMDPPQFVKSMEMFQTDGQFDPEKFRRSLSDPLMDWSTLEYWVRATLPITKLQEIVTWGPKISEEELKEAYYATNEKRTMTYVYFDPSATSPDESQITDARLREYYSGHKDIFTEPDQAKLAYLFLELKPSAADSSQVLGDLMGVLGEIKAGEDFAETARIQSEDPTADEGGYAGRTFKREELNTQMADVLFSLKVGEVAGPFLDPNGYHLVKLEEKTTVDGVEQVGFRNILRTVTPSQETVNALYEASQRVQNAIDQGRTLAEAAQAEGATVQETPYFRKDGFVPGLAGVPKARELAFQMKRGAIRGPFTTSRGHYFIELADRKEERLKPFDEVRDNCRAAVLGEMRAELAYEKATAFAEAAAADSLERVAAAESLVVQTAGPFNMTGYIGGLGRDLILVGAAFAVEPDDPPLAVEGQRGSYVIRVDSVQKPDQKTYEKDKETLRQRMLQQRRGAAYAAWIARLEDKADIKDYRQAF